jgi:hypothetical protein
MKPEQQDEYIVQALRMQGAMYEDDARQFLTEHDDRVRATALAEAKVEVVAWLVKKAAEGYDVGGLASKVDRGAVRIFLGTGHYRDAMDAHRAEVLNEAADYVEQRRLARADIVTDFDRGRRAAEGCVVEELRELAGEEATAAAATATPAPDFFEPGRTYTEPGDVTDWRFRCDAITTHPATGVRTALGWKHFRGEWSECSYDEDEWEIHQIADAIGQAGESRG